MPRISYTASGVSSVMSAMGTPREGRDEAMDRAFSPAAGGGQRARDLRTRPHRPQIEAGP